MDGSKKLVKAFTCNVPFFLQITKPIHTFSLMAIKLKQGLKSLLIQGLF